MGFSPGIFVFVLIFGFQGGSPGPFPQKNFPRETGLRKYNRASVLEISMPHAPQEIRTFFVTSTTKDRHPIFQTERMARLFIDVLQDNRKKGRFLLHEFVVMPDHFHLLVTPAENVPIEKAVQYIKGGFSFRAKKELGFTAEIWQESFAERRIKDAEDYEKHRTYIWENPVKRFLVEKPEMYPYSSASPGAKVDARPAWFRA